MIDIILDLWSNYDFLIFIVIYMIIYNCLYNSMLPVSFITSWAAPTNSLHSCPSTRHSSREILPSPQRNIKGFLMRFEGGPCPNDFPEKNWGCSKIRNLQWVCQNLTETLQKKWFSEHQSWGYEYHGATLWLQDRGERREMVAHGFPNCWIKSISLFLLFDKSA